MKYVRKFCAFHEKIFFWSDSELIFLMKIYYNVTWYFL